MGSCTHQHDCEEHACAADWSLFKNIEMSGVRALNEAIDGSAKSVFKPWENRLDFSTALESNDDDPELILFIPFTTDVKIKSISIIGGSDGTSPSKMRAFMNRDDIDFSAAADLLPIQEWELAENPHGEIEYLTKYAKFQGVASLTLHFPRNFGANATCIHYIGLRGEATQLKRDVVATTVYEAIPNPSDHRLPSESGAPQVL
ncbi:unnamed protein product [Sphagnum troendelagicum]|jgi:hypothetical protein|uniref:PITH domain-containing protein n=2 Tax=Sphagnum TaxID=13804 RepID=A0ABP0U1X0_9BRYO|nr:hypothetical protein BDL97_18G014700 [Sphagnum fallax]KAH8933137.1 hypothetical protein BDL97_18G014700 [Sphagnum fallax]